MTGLISRLSIFFLCSISCVYPLTCNAAPTAIGLVVWVTGAIKATMPGTSERSLTRRSAVYEADTLTTDGNSSGEIVFTDNSILSLHNNTTLEIAKYHFTKNAVSENSETLNLIKGGFRTITGAITKENPQSYKVNTPVATIGVAGTVYSAYFDTHSQDLFAKLDKGVVFVSNSQGKITLSKQPSVSTSGCGIDSYGQVSGGSKPVVLCNPPKIFVNEPPLIPVNFPSSNKAPGTVGSFCVS
ncbi:MAG: FecR domain-containing protein [Gammaproteobacteria bacterium]|nr:FecR domain-containing protein [Gammaproteobacteria bacterium]